MKGYEDIEVLYVVLSGKKTSSGREASSAVHVEAVSFPAALTTVYKKEKAISREESEGNILRLLVLHDILDMKIDIHEENPETTRL
jgi:hypothetical protein